jgi:Fur family ferric uptake transcriptional regulator
MTSTDPSLPPDAGVRPTRQRTAVIEALVSVDDFRSARELHDLLESREAQVGLATVYRTLQLLADAGAVDVLRREDGEATYRRCSRHHHHHLVCRSCSATVEVEGPAVERWTERVSSEHGFVDVSHTLEVFGTCASCRSA